MLKSYFRIAIRNLWRSKGLSLIHVLGLSLGLATCLLISLYIKHELSYDRFNKKADRIVRVVFNGRMQGGEIREANVMPMVAPTFRKDFPEIEAAVRLRAYGKPRVNYGEKTFREDRLAFADADIFNVFTLPLLSGNAATALKEPNSIVITPQVAERYFGKEPALGKTLLISDQQQPFRVTGVMETIPENSHFHFEILASMAGLEEAREPTWMSSNFYTYLLLPEGYDYRKLESRLQPLVTKYIGPQLEQSMGLSYADFQNKGNRIGFNLQPITRIHLHSDFTGDLEPYGDIRYVYIFSAVAIFMLLIACINFMNLSTAGASKRAKEIGIRKVMGSVKSQLVFQFILESMLISIVALLVSLLFVYLALPYFSQLAGQDIGQQLSENPLIIVLVIGLGLFTGLLAGSYPAFYLSSFNPIRVLKGKLSAGKRTTGLRSGLVVFQFFISITLIVGTVVVVQQLSYMRNKKLGYNKEQVLVIQEPYWLGKNFGPFMERVKNTAGVQLVTASGYLPAGQSDNNNFMAFPDNQSTSLVKSLMYEVDDQYIPSLGMQLVSGRNFSKLYGTDSLGVIINETAAKAYGWNEGAEGHTITRATNENRKTYTVIGIVKDFHFRSLHEPITPLVMTQGLNQGTIIARVNTSNLNDLIGKIKQEWDSFKPETAFSYSFLDERFEAGFQAEKNISVILGIFAGLTILVACLGLFGLAMFTADQRTREIGIRKVLGANVTSIVTLLSGEYVKLVLIGFAVASPLAWFVMNRWLQDFAYRISIGWWVFALSGGLAVLLAIVTVSMQAIKAANANPVVSLKAE